MKIESQTLKTNPGKSSPGITLSYIIPTYNEANNIEKTIIAIKSHTPPDYQYELIIVDHGSSDPTRDIAQHCGAKVFLHNRGTIAELRNFGAKHSKGKILIFLDADILLTEYWKRSIPGVIQHLQSSPPIITGSWVSTPAKATWIEKTWFSPLEKGGNSHINTAHLIIPRHIFFKLNGFNEQLETGEDYDISVRAKKLGVTVTENPDLKVIHEGYPKTLWDFFSREYWHGKGDAKSVATILRSKVALTSIVFIFFHLLIAISIATSNSILFAMSTLSVAAITCGSSAIKYKEEGLLTISQNCVLYYLYYWARGLSTAFTPWNKSIKKRSR